MRHGARVAEGKHGALVSKSRRHWIKGNLAASPGFVRALEEHLIGTYVFLHIPFSPHSLFPQVSPRSTYYLFITPIMKLSHVLPLAALSSAFVLPDEQVMSQIAIERPNKAGSIFDEVPSTEDIVHGIKDTLSSVVSCSKNAVDYAIEQASAGIDNLAHEFQVTEEATSAWLESSVEDLDFDGGHGRHGKHGKHGKGRHGRGKPNQTVYELISESKYTTKLAGLINEYPDVVELLNGTTANYTIFAPIDKAFEKIPEDAPKPSKEFLKKVLSYHVSADFYPAGRVLVTHTVPTLYQTDTLGPVPQRVSTNIGLRGLTVNFYSRIVAINIASTLSCYSSCNTANSL